MRHLVPRSRLLLAAAIIVAGLSAAGAILVANRYSISSAPWGYVQYDRWTGRAVACAVEEPTQHIRDSAVEAQNKRELLIAAGFSEREVSEYLSRNPLPAQFCTNLTEARAAANR